MTKPIGVVYVPVGLAGCNGIIRFTVVEQDVPPQLPVGIMRTLQASLDLTDDGDKVIFRQFGGESSPRTMQSGHTAIRADQFDPDGWQLPEITELCQDNDEGCGTNYMSVIAHVYQRPRCMDNDTSAGDHDPAPTRSCRPRQKTTSNGNGTREISSDNLFPLHHLGSRVVNKCTVLFKTTSGIYGRALSMLPVLGGSTAWNTVDDQTVETPRTLHGVRAMRGTLHPVSGISDVDPHGTIGRHLACIATTGATRHEGQEEQCCESSAGPVGAWQSLTERQLGTPWKKAPNDCDHPPNAVQNGGNAVTYYERCEMCGNRWQRIPLTMVARDPETKLNNRTVLASTGKRPVEIERPLLSTRTREHDDAGHAAAELSTGNARRAGPPQDSAWTGAMFDL